MTDFYLTRQAKRDLDEIEAFSRQRWGQARTKQYMADLYRAFAAIAKAPGVGESRRHRAQPFLMAPAEKHFAIYTVTDDGIIIVTVLHGRRNIEAILREIGPALLMEIGAAEIQTIEEGRNQ